MAEHHLDGSVTQPFWDRSVEPRLVVASGDTITFDCPEPCGQVEPSWTSDDLANLDFSKVHAVVGSVHVEGAAPGDTLQIDILDMRHKGWGWSAHIPHFGLLAEDFDFPYLHHWEIADATCRFGIGGIELPFEPFCGVLGVAPEEEGRFDTIPPRRNGGNIDIRDIGVGATAYLPVLVEGALFGCGDCHGAQGDGEVSGTAVESPMEVTLRLSVRKDVPIHELQFTTPGRRRDESRGYHVTTAHGPDLLEDSRNAIRAMIEWLGRERGLTPSQAYVLCSTAADLRISEVVDAPNWIVSAYLPLSIFPAGR